MVLEYLNALTHIQLYLLHTTKNKNGKTIDKKIYAVNDLQVFEMDVEYCGKTRVTWEGKIINFIKRLTYLFSSI